jgi:alkylation response protein AidB-like acyl-CoA dehydrogenase
MDFKFTEEQEAFRKQVCDFLEEELRKGTFEPQCEGWFHGFDREFSRKVGERGWIGLHLPKEYGGGGRTYVDRMICTEEMLRYGAPCAAYWMLDRQVGSALIEFGTEEQRKEFLPKIMKGEVTFSLCFSEPNAGSDLASVQTTAVEQDDCLLLNGQKIWTSGAHLAEYGWLMARTDLAATKKHRGLSQFILDMKLPGITIRPLLDITGGHTGLNEVFFDGVRMPKNALVGEKNKGFYQIMTQLDYERSGLERIMSNYPAFKDVVDYARETKRNGQPLTKDPVIRSQLAELFIEFEVGRLLIYRVAWVIDQGRVPNYEAALSKVYATAFEQLLAATAMQILGLEGQLRPESKWTPKNGKIAMNYLYSRVYTLQGGTSEILRNVVATRGLGLPTG